MGDTFLSKEELAILTGRKFKTKQIDQLRKMALPFWVNALGNPVVPRSAIEGRKTIPPIARPKVVPDMVREMNEKK